MTVLEDEVELRHDRLGRKQPRKVPLTNYVELAMRSKPERVREIPRSAITEDGVDDEGHFAMVTCPCGRKPIARYELAKCVGCERWYLLVAPAVFVLYGDMDPPALPG